MLKNTWSYTKLIGGGGPKNRSLGQIPSFQINICIEDYTSINSFCNFLKILYTIS